MSSHFEQVGQQEYENFIENNTKINSIVQNRRGFSYVHGNDTGMVPYLQAHKTIIGGHKLSLGSPLCPQEKL